MRSTPPYDNFGSQDQEEDDAGEEKWENGLYELLNNRGEIKGSRQGDRRRKRDRIKNWMTSGFSSSTPTPSSSLVQPIRLEDGSIMETPSDQRRETRAKFDKFFAGMPTLDEILSDEENSSEEDIANRAISEESSASDVRGMKSNYPSDDAWFEEEKAMLEEEYQKILEDARARVIQQRQEDPESLPANAEGVVETIVWQEMKRVIASVKATRAKERLQEYEIEKRQGLDAQDFTGATDDVVEQILKESAKDWELRDALQAQVDDFKRYEEDAYKTSSTSFQLVPETGENLDEWALKTLEDMLSAKQEMDDDSGISDTLEQSIDELRERIEKEAGKSSVKPESMKEWQMYRAIATRLGNRQERSQTGANDEIDEGQIASQLESWKQYVGKEEEMRKKAGLARGPTMPFEWQEAWRDPSQSLTATERRRLDRRSRKEVRREINMNAVKAMEELVRRSDPLRAESLKRGLEALKAELEPRDYHDIEEVDFDEEQDLGPVDLTDVFGTREASWKDEQSKTLVSATSSYSSPGGSENNIPPEPPRTPFFSGMGPESQQSSFDRPVDFSFPEGEDKKPKPPKTAFFADEDDGSYQADMSTQTSSKLGTVDEQKLQAMYRRAGARTEEEQRVIREQWESFQAFEKERRDESGLSNGDGSGLVERAEVKYDLSEVVKADGDFDAEKILASIGPRPTRKSRSSVSRLDKSSAPPSTEGYPGNSESDEGWKATEDALSSSVDPKDVSDSLYRSVSAIGGGRTKDDPAAKAQEKADFEAFVQKQDELRRSLDDLDEDAARRAAAMDGIIDDESYAEDALASLGPRPTFKRTRIIDEGAFSDRGGALGEEDDDDSLDSDDSSESVTDPGRSSLIPEWLQKEREQSKKKDGYTEQRGAFLGSDIDEVFDDTDYDRNMRQLAEYERRRSGQKRQMGIDVSDILGRGAASSDDYADYTFDDEYFRGKKSGWGSSSFEARKESLLEYTELSAVELNNLMDFKDSVHSTGVSQYLPRVNKPFKEFGAIFRLEGVFVDTTGLHDKAWNRVAASFGFRKPVLEEIKRAAVVRPDVAVKEIFYWTNDVIQCKDAVTAFRATVAELMEEWAKSIGISVPSPVRNPNDLSQSGSSMAIGNEVGSIQALQAPTDEASRMQLLLQGWSKTAEELGFGAPSMDQVVELSLLSPDIAVRDGLRWSYDSSEIDRIVSVFLRNVRLLSGDSITEGGADSPAPDSLQSTGSGFMGENELLELQYVAWTKVAEENRLEAPLPEEVLAASVLNDPRAVVARGFGWTDDPSKISDLAQQYDEIFAGLINNRVHNRNFEIPRTSGGDGSVQGPEQREGPSPEEILEAQISAWRTAAAEHGFAAPSSEQVELTMNMSASDAVRRLLAWTYNFNDEQIQKISATYEKSLTEASEKFIKKYNLKTQVVGPRSDPVTTEPNSDELFSAVFDAWTGVARKRGYSPPDEEQIMFAMAVGPEEAITTGFQWTNDLVEASSIAKDYKAEIETWRRKWRAQGATLGDSAVGERVSRDEEIPLIKVIDGGQHWLKSLRDVDMECGVVSYFEDQQVAQLLEYAGLGSLVPIDKRVSASNGYDRESQQLLGVALRLERRPDHCVIFDSSPYANVAARDVDMRSVSLVGAYPRYDLLTADTSASSFEELTAMNIRRLFGERVYDQPMLDMQQNQPETIRKVKTRFWDED